MWFGGLGNEVRRWHEEPCKKVTFSLDFQGSSCDPSFSSCHFCICIFWGLGGGQFLEPIPSVNKNYVQRLFLTLLVSTVAVCFLLLSSTPFRSPITRDCLCIAQRNCILKASSQEWLFQSVSFLLLIKLPFFKKFIVEACTPFATFGGTHWHKGFPSRKGTQYIKDSRYTVKHRRSANLVQAPIIDISPIWGFCKLYVKCPIRLDKRPCLDWPSFQFKWAGCSPGILR